MRVVFAPADDAARVLVVKVPPGGEHERRAIRPTLERLQRGPVARDNELQGRLVVLEEKRDTDRQLRESRARVDVTYRKEPPNRHTCSTSVSWDRGRPSTSLSLGGMARESPGATALRFPYDACDGHSGLPEGRTGGPSNRRCLSMAALSRVVCTATDCL